MSAADPGEPSPRDKFLGFRTYADDTPRMSDARAPAAAADATYPAYDNLNVEASDPYEDELPYDAPRDRRRAWPVAAGFTALALAVGVGVAWTRWGIDVPPQPAPSASPVARLPQRSAAVNSPAPTHPAPTHPASATLAPALPPPRLESIDRAPPAARAPAVAVVRRSGDGDPLGDTLAKVLRDLPAQPDQAAASAPPAAAASDPATVAAAEAPAARPSFDCRYARSYAQQMICEDPDLAAQDRRMTRAYAAALAAGAPQEQLRAEQGDWLNLREDAARRSAQAVRNIYEQRIEELEALAADGPG